MTRSTHQLVWTDQRVKAFWDYAATNPAFRSRFFAEVAAPYLAQLVVTRAGRLDVALDLGTGTGALLRELSRRGVRGVGFDISPDLMRAMAGPEEEDDWSLVCGEARRLPFRTGAFPAIFMVELLEHMTPEAGSAALQEVHRVMSRGGTLLVTTPADEELSHEMTRCPECGAVFHRTQHLTQFDRDALIQTIASAGFRVGFAKRFDPHHETAPLFKRFARRVLGLVHPTNLLLLATRP